MLVKNQRQIIENGQTPELRKIREDLLDILNSALEVVDPYKAVKARFEDKKIVFEEETFDISGFKNIFLIGFGKASVGMAQAVCDSTKVAKGVVITNDPDNKVQSEKVVNIVASHPLPDQNSIKGADKVLEIVERCGEDDLLIVLISGGGSALLCKPRVELRELQQTTDLLLKSGADINEVNTVRKHLSFVKGGQLVKSAKCKVVSFIMSDIVGDPIDAISSGPTYPDSTTYTGTLKILRKYSLWEKLPSAVIKVIEDGVHGRLSETPKMGDPVFDNVFNFIVANNKVLCKAAEDRAKKLGYKVMLLTTSLTGEAKDIGSFLVNKARSYVTDDKKIVFISGGETTVTVKGKGVGGRNQELVLSGVEGLDELDMVFASFATDGVDGASDAAGAIADGFTFNRAVEKNLDPDKYLRDNNSYEFFKRLDDLLITGPTGTNVMDIQIIVKTV
jgi:glycerate-2-kinase